MIRIFLLFAVVFFFGLSPALAQEDAYDEYLSKKKGSTKAAKSNNKAFDYRERYMDEAGASLYWFEVNSTAFGPAIIGLPGINYIGRLALNANPDRYSLTLGTQPSLGLQIGNFASYFMLSIPVVLEGNIGLGSSIYSESKFGAFAGIGPEFTLARSWGDFAYPFRTDQLGAVVSAGLRFGIRQRSYYLRYSEAFWAPVQGQYFRSIAFGNALY
jgi:hypothetical protein